MTHLLEVLAVIAVCIAFRVLAYLLFQRQPREMIVASVEVSPVMPEPPTQSSAWPVVILFCVVVSSIVALMAFGCMLGGE